MTEDASWGIIKGKGGCKQESCRCFSRPKNLPMLTSAKHCAFHVTENTSMLDAGRHGAPPSWPQDSPPQWSFGTRCTDRKCFWAKFKSWDPGDFNFRIWVPRPDQLLCGCSHSGTNWLQLQGTRCDQQHFRNDASTALTTRLCTTVMPNDTFLCCWPPRKVLVARHFQPRYDSPWALIGR